MAKKNQVSLLTALLAAALTLTACSPVGPGGLAPQVSPTITATATPMPTEDTVTPAAETAIATVPASSAPSPSQAPGDQPIVLTVTLAQNNQSISLQPGQRFLLDLGDTMRWTVSIDQQAVVSRVTGITVIKGAQGVYQANKTGQAVLNAVGLPVCGKGPCSMLALDFSVTIMVTAATAQPSSNYHY